MKPRQRGLDKYGSPTIDEAWLIGFHWERQARQRASTDELPQKARGLLLRDRPTDFSALNRVMFQSELGERGSRIFA